jgi:hypothetical protein
MNSLNIRPYLFGVESTTKRGSERVANTSSSTFSANQSWGSTNSIFSSFSLNRLGSSEITTGDWIASVKRIAVYLFAVIIIVGILLLFVHFFITPVFRWKPGAPGWLPVPGWDDGTLFWKKGVTGQILNKDLPIRNDYMNYTLQLDLFLENPLQFATHPRILLTRGAVRKSSPSGDTLLSVLEQYNLAIALKPDTNDMIVSVLNKDRQMETAILSNIPIQETFRLVVVVMERAMEVYLNSHLVRTVTFQAPPMDVKGDIFPASGVEANIVRYRNLKLWPRVLTTPEIRDTSPAMSTPKEMGAGPIPTSSTATCGSSPSP